MKKLITVFVCAAMLLSCSSCVQKINLSDRAIVQTLGIDRSKKGYRLTFDIYDTENSGENEPVGQKIISVDCASIKDGFQAAETKHGKKIFHAKNRLLILGKELAGESIVSIIGYFENDPEANQNACLLVGEGDAENVISVMAENSIQAKTLYETLALKNSTSTAVDSLLFGVSKAKCDGEDYCLPVIMPDKEKGEVILDGAYMFHDGKIAERLDEKNYSMLKLINGNTKRFAFTAHSGSDGAVSADLFDISSSLKTTVEGGRLCVKVDIKALGNVAENAENDSRINESEIKEFESIIQTSLKKALSEGIKKTLLSGCDVLHLFTHTLYYENAFAKEKKPEWSEITRNAAYSVNVKFNFYRYGTGKTE